MWGGGYITRGGEMHIVQGVSLTTTLKEIGAIVIGSFHGTPLRIRDIGEVKIGHEIRLGAVSAHGKGEAVLGLGFMLMGENSHRVTGLLKERMEEIKKTLPKDVKVTTVYDRTELVDHVIETVKKNLLEGALLVVAILFIFLGNLRAGLIVALAIPLSMFFAFNAIWRMGIAGSLMSLGAIDFGLIVDSSVIMVENSVRHLAEDRDGRSVLEVVREAALEVRKPTMFGELIIMIVFVPVLALEGVEGKLFRPMALTVIFALLASLVLSLTLMPVLASLFLPRQMKEREGFLMKVAKFFYRPVVRFALWGRYMIILFTLLLLGGGVWLSLRLGSEFIPRLSEMALVINTVRLSGVSLEESVRYGSHLEKVILEKYPHEVQYCWTRTGTAEVATDPMGMEVSDIFITLKPRRFWKRARDQDELVRLIGKDLDGMPGMRMIFTQPIEMRINEMIAGIRSDLGIKIVGDDFDILAEKAREVERVLKSIPGSEGIYSEQITGLPVLEIKVRQEALSRHGLSAKHVLEMVEVLGGIKVGEIREDQKRFDLVVRLPEKFRKNPEAVRGIFITTGEGKRLPLTALAQIRQVEGPSTITREWQRRRIVVQCNVRGRDIGSFVSEVQSRLEKEVILPAGYHFDYGGQFEHLQRAKNRLMIVVPIVLFLILFLLYTSTGSMADGLMIFTGAPFASLGGVVALWLRGMPFTISAAVGFIAVSGVSVLNGLVMVSTIQQLLKKGHPMNQAIEESALRRLRPVLMTALVAALGFIPMALNTGVGAEVQRPLATVVIGGVVSDTLLTLLVLPALYSLFGKERGGEK